MDRINFISECAIKQEQLAHIIAEKAKQKTMIDVYTECQMIVTKKDKYTEWQMLRQLKEMQDALDLYWCCVDYLKLRKDSIHFVSFTTKVPEEQWRSL